MLAARGTEHLDRFAIQEDDRAHVHPELQVDVLGLVIGGCGSDAHAGVVDEHVEPPESLLVARDDAGDRVGVRQVRRDGLHLAAAAAQALRRRLERVGLAGADGQPVALGGKGLREREPDTTAGSGDDGGTVRHGNLRVRDEEPGI